jgi:hypothetical protein
MSLVHQHIKVVEINGQTLIAPPPFSHQYHLLIDLSADSPEVTFELSYTGRESLSEEEILEEGFTLEDDFGWQGTLPRAWKFALIEQLRKTKSLFDKAKPHAQQLLGLHLSYETGEKAEGIPANSESWEYFTQELIQAVFEMGQKERPLEVIYLEVGRKNRSYSIRLQPSFGYRKVKVEQEEDGHKSKKEHEWKALKPLLEAVYLPDYDVEQARQSLPRKAGKYLMPGDGLWYELGKAVTSPGKKYDAVAALEQAIKSLA